MPHGHIRTHAHTHTAHPTPKPTRSLAHVPQGEMNAMFLRHEGFLGAVGAFLTVHPMTVPDHHTASGQALPRKVGAGPVCALLGGLCLPL